MFLQLNSFITFVIGHKEAICTLGYPIASKLGDYVAGHHSVHRQTHTGLYNIDVSRILVVHTTRILLTETSNFDSHAKILQIFCTSPENFTIRDTLIFLYLYDEAYIYTDRNNFEDSY